MAVQVNPITQSLPATTAIQDPATRRFAQAVEDALRALRSEEGAVESLKKAADAMNNAVAGGTPPSIAQWLFSSELYQKLTSEIARIDVEAKQDLLDEALARQTAIDEINDTLATIQSTAAYDSLVTYAIGDMVTYDGKLYQAILETTGNLPTNTTYWKKVGDYATLGDIVAAHTLDIDDLESRVTTDEGNLTAEIASRQALATQVRGTYTGTNVNLVTQGLIYSERVARSTADSTEVAKRESLSAKILGATDPDGLTLSTLSEGLIFDERQARVSGDGANASSISALRAQVGVTEAGALTTGLILDEKNVRASNDLAIVSAVNTALARITGVSTSISQSGENLVANWTQAQATKWSQIESEVLTSGGQTIRAALQQEATTRANADGSLGAQWTIKTDINGYISGFGFASTANNATPTSEFVIRADKFAVVMPGYGEHIPFAIGPSGAEFTGLTSWGNVQGKTGFASISQITTSNVTTYIANAAIGNAQIGGDIWSSNFVAGSAGWRIYRSGSAEFRNITARGNIEATSLKTGVAMVDALNIKGSAMIIPIFISHGAGSWNMPYSQGTWQHKEVWKYTFTTGTVGTFRISFGGLWTITHYQGHANWPAGTVHKMIRILVDGNPVETIAQATTYGGILSNINIGDRFYTIGAGTHTISVYMSALMADGGATFSRSAGTTTLQSHSQGASSI